MFTIVASSTTISWAVPSTARISQRRVFELEEFIRITPITGRDERSGSERWTAPWLMRRVPGMAAAVAGRSPLFVRRCELGGAHAQQLAEIGRHVARVGDHPLASERQGGQQLAADLRDEHWRLQWRGAVESGETQERGVIIGVRVADADRGRGGLLGTQPCVGGTSERDEQLVGEARRFGSLQGMCGGSGSCRGRWLRGVQAVGAVHARLLGRRCERPLCALFSTGRHHHRRTPARRRPHLQTGEPPARGVAAVSAG